MNKNITQLSGAITSLIIPINRLGKIDYRSYDFLVDFQLKNGVKGLVICGYEYETTELSYNEYKKLIRNAINKTKGSIPVIAGVSSKHALKHAEWAQEEDIDAVILYDSTLIKTDSESLFNHYKELALNVKCNVIIGNDSKRNGYDIPLEVLVRLTSEVANIIGISEAWGDINRIENLKKLVDKNIKVFSANDEIGLLTMVKGADGCISRVANIIPEEFSGILEDVELGQITKSYGHNSRYIKLMEILNSETSCVPVKLALCMMGFIQEEFRLPADKLNLSSKSILKEEMKALSLVKPEAYSLIRAWI